MTPLERETFILSQMPRINYYARVFARRFRYTHAFELGDLVNEGVIGAINATHDFDPDKGAALSTYASYRIWGAILDFIRSRKVDPLPRSQRAKAAKGEFYFRLTQYGDIPKEAQPTAQDPTEPIDLRQLYRWSRLTKREQFIIQRHFIEGYTLDELSKAVGICPARATQIKDEALAKMSAAAK